MDHRKKLFVNKDLTDEELFFVKEALGRIDLEEYLQNSFVYVSVFPGGGLEIVSVKDDYVYLISKEFSINNKMSMEYLRHKNKIEQNLNEVLYWNGINNIKKYVPVISNNGIIIEYADINVYSSSVAEAVKALDNMLFDDYMYLEDVDEEI
jgi:hypothetical protein